MTTARVLAILAVLATTSPSVAGVGACGQPYSGGVEPITTDALFIMRTSVGLSLCDLCVCDTNGNGAVTTPDALLDLRYIVGQDVDLKCPPCPETTTTTTMGGCPSPGDLDDCVFNEIYTCIQKFNPGSYFCADQDVGDTIRFQHQGGGMYEVRDEPDTGFVYNGTLSCTTFTWSALSPGEYTESGVWEFTSDLESFSGDSTYSALGGGYSGICNTTGEESPGIPPNPPTLAPCN